MTHFLHRRHIIAILCLAFFPIYSQGANPAFIPVTQSPEYVHGSGHPVTLHGSIALNGKAAYVAFQKRNVGQRRWVGHTPWQKIPRGQTNVNFSAVPSGIHPGVNYQVRAIALVKAIRRNGNAVEFSGSAPTDALSTGQADNITATSATLHGAVNLLHPDETGVFFEWGLDTSYGARVAINVPGEAGEQPVEVTLQNLLPATTYHFRVISTNAHGTFYGNNSSFTTRLSFAAATVGPSQLTAISANLGGTVTTTASEVETYFEWGTTTNYGNRTASQLIHDGLSTGIQHLVTNLASSTTYHFRIVAANTEGTIYGADVSFTTPVASTTATTIGSNNGTSTSVTLLGTVSTTASAVAAYFEWGTTTNYGNGTSAQPVATGANQFPIQHNISNLSPGTLYHFRLVATNSAGAVYGSDLTFVPQYTPPTATTEAAMPVTTEQTTLNGLVTAHDLAVAVLFEWGVTTNYGSTSTSILPAGSLPIQVSTTIGPLNAGMTYHFRIVASNSAGVSYGADRLFVTPCATMPVAATVTNCTEADLRAALAVATTIRFDCEGTLTLTRPIDVYCSLTLDASGHSVILSGGDSNRLFMVHPGGELQLHNLTLANGRHQGTNSTAPFTGHGEPAHAGAIAVEQGTFTAINCLFTNNAAIGGNGSEYSSTFLDTTAVGHGGSALGAAIFGRSSLVNLTNCTFVNNQTVGGAGSRGTGSMPPWGFFHQSPPGYSKGGALYLSNCTAVLAQCSLEGNQAAPGSAFSGRSSGLGGAVHVEGGSANLVGCSLNGNRAAGDGGAIYNIEGSIIVNLSEMRTNLALSPGAGSGAAICSSSGSLTVSDTTFDSNQAFGGNAFINPPSIRDWLPGQPGRGAALAILAGTASVERCYFGANSVQGGNGARHGSFPMVRVEAGNGVGGAIFNAGTTAIRNSTFTQNTATPGLAFFDQSLPLPPDGSSGHGGAIANVGGTSEIQFSTIAENSAARGSVTNQIGEPLGAGLFSASGTFALGNSILAWNIIDITNSANAFGAISDAGNNLSSDTSPVFGPAGSINNVDPLLGPLGNNGGPTLTFPLLPRSPAIDAANASNATASDQRGVPRPQGPAPDIGAFERQ